MDTIINYLENMFASFPKTPEILNLKRDLSIGMEDKYNELKTLGKSENEAIGIVISEFGNIEELVEELNIPQSNVSPTLTHARIVTAQEVNDFLADKRKYGRFTAIGVFLCIIGVGIFLFLGAFLSSSSIASLGILSENILQKQDAFAALSFIPLFILVGIAVAFFIFASSHLEKYKYLENPFVLDYGIENEIRRQKEAYRPTYTLGISCGVISCIFSGLVFLLMSSLIMKESLQGLSLLVTMFLVSIAVFILISTQTVFSSFDQLLKENDYKETKESENKIIAIVASIVWPLVTAAYLLWSFLTNDWHITWIIWPVTGILFGAFSAVCSILTKKEA